MALSEFLRYLKPEPRVGLSTTAQIWQAWEPGDSPLSPADLTGPHVVSQLHQGKVKGWELNHPLVMLLRTGNLPAIEAFWDPRPFEPSVLAASPPPFGNQPLSDFAAWGVWEAAFSCRSQSPLVRLLDLVPLSAVPSSFNGSDWGRKWDPWHGFGASPGLGNDELEQRLRLTLNKMVPPATEEQSKALLHKVLRGAASAGLSDRCLFLSEVFGLDKTLDQALSLLQAGDVSGGWALLRRAPGFSLGGGVNAHDGLLSSRPRQFAEDLAQSLVLYSNFLARSLAKKLPKDTLASHRLAWEQWSIWLLKSLTYERWRDRYDSGTPSLGLADAPFASLLLALPKEQVLKEVLPNKTTSAQLLAQLLVLEANKEAPLLTHLLESLTPADAMLAARSVGLNAKRNDAFNALLFKGPRSEGQTRQCAMLWQWLQPLRAVEGLNLLDASDEAASKMDLPSWPTFRLKIRSEALDETLPSPQVRPARPRF